MGKGLQYARTDMCIVNAFIDLVSEQGFEKVSVQSIIQRAMISKNTFYMHYADKYDLAEQLYEKGKADFRGFLSEQGEQSRKLANRIGDTEPTLSPQALSDYFSRNGRILNCLMRIRTDRVNMENFIADIYKERYLRFEEDDGRGAEIIRLESDIYASIFRAVSAFFGDKSVPADSIDSRVVDTAMCNAFLRAFRIIEKDCRTEAAETLFRLQYKAKHLPENYNN